MSFHARLYLLEGRRIGRGVAVGTTATVGRDAENDIVLNAASVSRAHALLLSDDEGLLLSDLESTNGTFVNGTLVPPDRPRRLADGDIVKFGQVLARYQAHTRDKVTADS